MSRAFGRPGGDLLSRVLRRSTIGAEGFHGRVRDGIGCLAPRYGHQAQRVMWGRRKCLSACWGLTLHAGGGAVPMAGTGEQADRAISTGQLRGLLPFHLRPIDVVVCHGSQRDLVLRRVSRLDAFSGYPVRT